MVCEGCEETLKDLRNSMDVVDRATGSFDIGSRISSGEIDLTSVTSIVTQIIADGLNGSFMYKFRNGKHIECTDWRPLASNVDLVYAQSIMMHQETLAQLGARATWATIDMIESGKFGEIGGCEVAQVQQVGVGASTIINRHFTIGAKSCDKQVPGQDMAAVIVLCSLCDIGDSSQDMCAERIIREAIERHRPDRKMRVLNPARNDGDLNIGTSSAVRTCDEAVTSRIPIWQERLSLSKLYVEKKRADSMIHGQFREQAMKTIKPSRQIYHEAITQGRQHSLYIVVYTKQKGSTFAAPAEGASRLTPLQ